MERPLLASDNLAVEKAAVLFRALGADEFYAVMNTKQFAIHPKCVPVKYFGLDFDETLTFANMIINIDIVAVLEVIVDKVVLDRIGDFTSVDTFLFKKGTVEIQPENLHEFNQSISDIIHRF